MTTSGMNLEQLKRRVAHLGLCGSAVLICATHEDGIVAAQTAEAGIAVSAEHTAHDVAQVGHIIDVRQCAGDHDVPLACSSSHRASAPVRPLAQPFAIGSACEGGPR